MISVANKGLAKSKTNPNNVIRKVLKKAFGTRISLEYKEQRNEHKILDFEFSKMAATIIIILRRVNCQ